QKGLGKSPRSTVGTVTEIADYLRLLFARVGVPHCPKSGKVLRAYTVQEIVDSILSRGDGAKAALLAPVVRRTKGDLGEELERLRRDGFVRVRVDGEQVDLGDATTIDRTKPHDLDVVVDRIVVLELKLGDGTLLVDATDGSEPVVMSERLVSWEFGITLPPLEPRLFSFNSPHGACPTCDGLGVRSTVDVGRVVPDPARSLREGAVLAFGRRGSVATATEVARVVELLHVNPDVAWKDLPEEQRDAILNGMQAPKGKRRSQPSYEGIVARLERMLEAGEPDAVDEDESDEGAIGAEDVGRFVVTRTCPACNGVRLRPEALAVRVADKTIAELCSMPLRTLKEFLGELGKDPALTGRD